MPAFRSAAGLSASTGSGPTVPNPSGRTAGDMLLGIMAFKPYTITVTSGTITTFGTLISDHANGTTASGANVGSEKLYLRAGEDPGTGALANLTTGLSGGPAPAAVAAVSFQKLDSSATWSMDYADADDLTFAGTDVAVTAGSTLDITVGDWLVWVVALSDDITLSAVDITVPGCTLGTISEALPTNTSTLSGDVGLYVFYAEVTAGTASGAPSGSATGSSATNSGAATSFLRIREVSTEAATVYGAAASMQVLTADTPPVLGAGAALSALTVPDVTPRQVSAVSLAVLVPSVLGPVNDLYTGWGVRL